jgi:hypothetical protein
MGVENWNCNSKAIYIDYACHRQESLSGNCQMGKKIESQAQQTLSRYGSAGGAVIAVGAAPLIKPPEK